MRKVFCLFLAAMICLSLCACITDDSISTDYKNSTHSTEQQIEPVMVSTNPEISETEPIHYPVQLIGATDFSDGIAWVLYYDDLLDKSTVGLLDLSGKIIRLELDEPLLYNDYRQEPFSAGYSYINYTDHYVIIDNTGKITATSPKNDTYRIIAGGDGVYLVLQEIRNFSENEDRYGFIDANGNWIIEPSMDHQFQYGEQITGQPIPPTFSYLGENVYVSSVDGYKNTFYSLDSNTYYQHNTKIEYLGQYYNGYAIFMDSDGNVYNISKDLEVTELFNGEGYGQDVHSHDGIVFFEYSYVDGTYGAAFYSAKDGSELFSLSNYTLLNTDTHRKNNFYCFIDGAAAICLQGADRKNYITLIDTEGNFLMEPIIYEAQSAGFGIPKQAAYGTYSEGKIYVCGIEQSYILCSDGTVYETAKHFGGMDSEEISFHNGMAWSAVNCCFVDVSGVTLYTFIESE